MFLEQGISLLAAARVRQCLCSEFWVRVHMSRPPPMAGILYVPLFCTPPRPRNWEVNTSERYRLDGIFSNIFGSSGFLIKKLSKILCAGGFFPSTKISGGPGIGMQISLPCSLQ